VILETAAMELASEAAGTDQEHSIAVTATETMWVRFQKRLVGKSVQGLTGPSGATDQGEWLHDQLAALNAANSTKIQPGSVTPSANITGGGPWRYMPFLELIQYLSSTINGFDFWQTALQPEAFGQTGLFNIAPLRGTDKSETVVLEYGVNSNNARDYRYIIDSSRIINRGIVLPPSYPDSTGLEVVTEDDATSQTTRGLREEVLQVDLTNTALRTDYAEEAVFLRKQPRELFILNPSTDDGTGRVPNFKTDYDLGDIIRGRVVDTGVILLDALVRVYGVKVSLDDEGQETIDLMLVDEA